MIGRAGNLLKDIISANKSYTVKSSVDRLGPVVPGHQLALQNGQVLLQVHIYRLYSLEAIGCREC